MADRGTISNIIRQLVTEFTDPAGGYHMNPHPVTSAYDINNGLCEDFALEVIRRMGGSTADLYDQDLHNFSGTADDPCSEDFDAEWLAQAGYRLPHGVTVEALNRNTWSHILIHYKGRYYDAECPDGTDTPFALPLVLNNLKLAVTTEDRQEIRLDFPGVV